MRIIHLTDVHFGPRHQFDPPPAPTGALPPARGFPTLLDSLRQDWSSSQFQPPSFPQPNGDPSSSPLLVAITGDLTECAAPEQFASARALVSGLAGSKVFGTALGVEDIRVVPGNHDVAFKQADPRARWGGFCEFYEELWSHRVRPRDAHLLSRIIDNSARGFVIAEINSCFDVQEGTAEALRGYVDPATITRLENELAMIDPDHLERSVRIALMHHHPVVLPTLAEAGSGYDGIYEAQWLLNLLRKYRFHVLLHGHKHHAQTFSYDTVCAWVDEPPIPLVVVAGGSAGSKDLPRDGAVNTYNAIAIKWHPAARLARVRIVTRGLVTKDKNNGNLPPTQWTWRTFRDDDRILSVGASPPPVVVKRTRAFGSSPDDVAREQVRRNEYDRLRRNLPVIEVMPSLVPGQDYEVRLWIEAKPGRGRYDPPDVVEWSAGDMFPVVTCHRTDDAQFTTSLAYYGPFLAQARLRFSDGVCEDTFVFARMPGRDPTAVKP